MSAKGQKRTDQSNGDYGFLSESGHRRRDARGQLRAAVLALASTAAAGAAGIRRAEIRPLPTAFLYPLLRCGFEYATPPGIDQGTHLAGNERPSHPRFGGGLHAHPRPNVPVGWRNRPATTKRPQISFSRGPLLNASPRGVSPSRAAEEHPDRTPRDRGASLVWSENIRPRDVSDPRPTIFCSATPSAIDISLMKFSLRVHLVLRCVTPPSPWRPPSCSGKSTPICPPVDRGVRLFGSPHLPTTLKPHHIGRITRR